VEKVTLQYIIEQYQKGVADYVALTLNVGLWDSEQSVFQQYIRPQDHILDLGCGAGRTSFALSELGYRHITAVDLTPAMIEAARELNLHFQQPIDFQVGDATALAFAAERFDAVIFSYNGLMSIPQKKNRLNAAQEIHRVLKPGGIWIFTTHDRERDTRYQTFWEAEAQRWNAGDIPQMLYEFGDLITPAKNEPGLIYIHIPDQQEVEALLATAQFQVLDTFFRSDRFEERLEVRKATGPCRFWIAGKAPRSRD